MSASSSATAFTTRRCRVKDSDEQASLFLRKAYHLITNCPQSLGGWTEEGDTFLVKDAKLFSEKVIPTVYKHNNFSSFVRQLNFYGFRKIKSDLSSAENPWWEFRHPKFIRGMPHLLSEIKRAVHCVMPTEASVAKETDVLKGYIIELQDKLVNVDKSLAGLVQLVSSFVKSTGHPMTAETSHLLQDIDSICGKKREASNALDGPASDNQRTRLAGETSYDDTNFSYYGQCTIEEDSDDAESLSDDVAHYNDDKESTHDANAEQNFDNFLAYIADENHITPLPNSNSNSSKFASDMSDRKAANPHQFPAKDSVSALKRPYPDACIPVVSSQFLQNVREHSYRSAPPTTHSTHTHTHWEGPSILGQLPPKLQARYHLKATDAGLRHVSGIAPRENVLKENTGCLRLTSEQALQEFQMHLQHRQVTPPEYAETFFNFKQPDVFKFSENSM